MMYLLLVLEVQNKIQGDDDEDEMPSEGLRMRCGEWWASLLDLLGSVGTPTHCYPPLTWLTFCLLDEGIFTGVYWVDVDGSLNAECPEASAGSALTWTFYLVPP